MAAGVWAHLRHDAERKTADTEECAACSHLSEVQKQNYVITTEQQLLLGAEGRVGWEGQGWGLLGCQKCF